MRKNFLLPLGKNSRERGNIMAYFAAFLAFVVVPLAALTIDIVRAFYVYTHLQAATDAACEAAAQALDVSTFIRTGTRQIDLGLGTSYASREWIREWWSIRLRCQVSACSLPRLWSVGRLPACRCLSLPLHRP